jgi:hypothetical protein
VLSTSERYLQHSYAQNQTWIVSWQANGDDVYSDCGVGEAVVRLNTPGRSQISEERELSLQAPAYPEQVCSPNIFSLGQPRLDDHWAVSVTSNVVLYVVRCNRFARPAGYKCYDNFNITMRVTNLKR